MWLHRGVVQLACDLMWYIVRKDSQICWYAKIFLLKIVLKVLEIGAFLTFRGEFGLVNTLGVCSNNY